MDNDATKREIEMERAIRSRIYDHNFVEKGDL